MSNLSFDIAGLAAHICNIDVDEGDDAIELALQRKFNIEMDQFEQIVAALLPTVVLGEGEMSDQMYQGFANIKDRRFFVKQIIQEDGS